jgi:hypothetical protein
MRLNTETNDKTNDGHGKRHYRRGAEMTTWFGRTDRMDKKRWPGKVLECVPQEKRERGRQRRGWRDDIKRAMEARNMAEEDCYRREERRETGGGETATAVN